MILFSLVVILSILYGYIVVSSLLAVSSGIPGLKVMRWGLIPGTGVGVFSLLSFVAFHLFSGNRFLFILFHCLVAAVGLIAFKAFNLRKQTANQQYDFTPESCPKLLSVLAGGVVITALAAFVLSVLTKPNGEWDTFAIWNLHARFIFLSGANWREEIHNLGLIGVTHTDYPLLLPAFIAGSWVWMGRDALIVPAYTAFCFTFGSIAVLWGALSMMRGEKAANVAIIILLGARLFVLFGGWEQADVPLGYFLLSSLSLWFISSTGGEDGVNRRILILAALELGFTAWTKNEGIMDALIVSLVFAFTLLRTEGVKVSRVDIMSWIYGLTAPIGALVWFKLTIAPPNDIMAGQGWHSTIARITDIARYKIIMVAFAKDIIGFSPGPRGIVPIMAIYRWIAGGSKITQGSALLAPIALIPLVILMGDFAVYLITPKDLPWQLTSSFKRLLIQIWPSVVYIYCLTTNFLEKGSRQYASAG